MKRVSKASFFLLILAVAAATAGCGPKSSSQTPLGQQLEIPDAAPVHAPPAKQGVTAARRRIQNAVTSSGCHAVFGLSTLAAPIRRVEWCKFVKTLAGAAFVGQADYKGQAAIIDYRVHAKSSYPLTAVLIRDKDGLYHIAFVTGGAGEPVADTTAPRDVLQSSVGDVVDALRKRDCSAFAKVMYTGFGPGVSGNQTTICNSLLGSPLPAALAADGSLKPKVYGSNAEFAFLGFDTPVGHYTVVLSTPPAKKTGGGATGNYEYVDSFLTNFKGGS
jgi:hypothetical protein